MNIKNWKVNKKLLKRVVLISTSLILIVFCIYTDFYYKKISISTLETQYIVCNNAIFNFISKVLDKLINSILNKENVRVIIIVVSIVFIFHKFNLRDLLDEINSFEFSGFKMQLNSKKTLETIDKQEQDKVKKLKNVSTDDEYKKSELELSTKKMNLIKIFSTDTFLLDILDRFISKKRFSVSIPFYVLQEKTTITSIGKIFEYKITPNTIKIIKIKDDIKDLVYELYFQIQNEIGNKTDK